MNTLSTRIPRRGRGFTIGDLMIENQAIGEYWAMDATRVPPVDWHTTVKINNLILTTEAGWDELVQALVSALAPNAIEVKATWSSFVDTICQRPGIQVTRRDFPVRGFMTIEFRTLMTYQYSSTATSSHSSSETDEWGDEPDWIDNDGRVPLLPG